MKNWFLTLTILSGALSTQAQDIPFVYETENSGAGTPAPVIYPFDQLPEVKALTNPLGWSDRSGVVKNFSDWERRRNEIAY